MNNLVFGDTDIMKKLLECTPHIIEDQEDHCCDCEYCTYEGDPEYRCSECSCTRDEIHKFYDDYGNCICPNCKTELITEKELSDMMWMKSAQYKGIEFIIDKQSIIDGEPRCFISKKMNKGN